MSDADEDKLAEDINEFDRLMAEHEALQSTGETQDFVVADDLIYTVGAAKPDVDIDDAGQGGIELVQLPVADDKEKSKQPTEFWMIK